MAWKYIFHSYTLEHLLLQPFPLLLPPYLPSRPHCRFLPSPSFFPPRHFGALSARKNVPSGKDSHYCSKLSPSPRSAPSPVLRRRSFPRRRSPMWPSLVRCPWNKSPPLPRQSSFPLASRLRQQREVAEKGPILPTSFCDGFQNSWASRVAVRLPILPSG